MARKMATMGAVILAGLAALAALTGCGGSSQPQAQNLPAGVTSPLANPGNNSQGALSQQIDALKKMAMTVEIVENGKSEGKWTQGADGSWRYQGSDGTIFIYNAAQKKSWLVNGNSAYESPVAEASYAAFNPAMMLTAFAYLPQTGGSGDVREYSEPGQGKITIEFKGPNGLPSKVTNVDKQGKTTVTEFNYSDVGSVPESDFELPSGVSVSTVPGAGAGASVTPGGENVPAAPGGSAPSLPPQQ